MTSLTRKERDFKNRERLIIDKSRELFFKHGFGSVTIQDICDAIEYGRSVIYSHFQSKEEIYAHIKLEGITLLADHLNTLNTNAKNKETEFIKSSKIFYDFYASNNSLYNAIFLLPIPVIPDQLEDRIQQQIDRSLTPIYALIDKIVPHNWAKSKIEATAHLYWTSLTGIINFFIQHPDQLDYERIRKNCIQHAKIYFYGMKKI